MLCFSWPSPILINSCPIFSSFRLHKHAPKAQHLNTSPQEATKVCGLNPCRHHWIPGTWKWNVRERTRKGDSRRCRREEEQRAPKKETQLKEATVLPAESIFEYHPYLPLPLRASPSNSPTRSTANEANSEANSLWETCTKRRRDLRQLGHS